MTLLRIFDNNYFLRQITIFLIYQNIDQTERYWGKYPIIRSGQPPLSIKINERRGNVKRCSAGPREQWQLTEYLVKIDQIYMRDVGFEAGSVRKGCEWQAEIEAEEEFSNATSAMGKKATKCRKNCKAHTFLLKPVHYSAYFTREVQISFCPPALNHPPIFPVFNFDRKHYTSAFSLKEDQNKYQANDAIYKSEHEKCCLLQAEGKSEMFVPKPRSKCQYCHVCKEYYDDYLNHIKSPQHKEKHHSNKFTVFINQFIQQNYPKRDVEENADESPQNFPQSWQSVDKEGPVTHSFVGNESFRSLNGQGAFDIPPHNLKRCDSFRLTIGSQQNKEQSGDAKNRVSSPTGVPSVGTV